MANDQPGRDRAVRLGRVLRETGLSIPVVTEAMRQAGRAVHPATVGNWRAGTHLPRPSTLLLLSAALRRLGHASAADQVRKLYRDEVPTREVAARLDAVLTRSSWARRPSRS